jgi:hypothetical protein
MAATTTLTTLVDGTKTKVIQAVILSADAAELTDSVIYDYSADTLLPDGSTAASTKIMSISYANPTAAGQIFIEFDGTTDVMATGCGIGDSHKEDHRWCGGLKNNATVPTGDVTVSTLGLATADQVTIVIEIAKH